jgi:hypothetical protein
MWWGAACPAKKRRVPPTGCARKSRKDARPDLVVWQVGTNDGLRQVELEKFKNCLRTTLAWLAGRGIDVVFINPKYGQALVKDAYYEQVVGAIAEVARQAGVLLVDRFDAMRELQRGHGDGFYLAADRLHMNDVGYRAEQLARALVGNLVQADAEQDHPVFDYRAVLRSARSEHFGSAPRRRLRSRLAADASLSLV